MIPILHNNEKWKYIRTKEHLMAIHTTAAQQSLSCKQRIYFLLFITKENFLYNHWLLMFFHQNTFDCRHQQVEKLVNVTLYVRINSQRNNKITRIIGKTVGERHFSECLLDRVENGIILICFCWHSRNHTVHKNGTSALWMVAVGINTEVVHWHNRYYGHSLNPLGHSCLGSNG